MGFAKKKLVPPKIRKRSQCKDFLSVVIYFTSFLWAKEENTVNYGDQ